MALLVAAPPLPPLPPVTVAKRTGALMIKVALPPLPPVPPVAVLVALLPVPAVPPTLVARLPATADVVPLADGFVAVASVVCAKATAPSGPTVRAAVSPATAVPCRTIRIPSPSVQLIRAR
ncbi:MAG TPA: hypothetical protein VM684_03990, partial [Gaiellales bacterium]|nr:hypothetical protein [Gaiellales bacterium]